MLRIMPWVATTTATPAAMVVMVAATVPMALAWMKAMSESVLIRIASAMTSPMRHSDTYHTLQGKRRGK